MNLLHSSVALLTVAFSLNAATLTGAYNAYLDGSYETSYSDYTSIYESSGSRDALYGMINSLVALKRYDEALVLTGKAEDPILTAKEMWILGLQDRRSDAAGVATKVNGLPAESQSMILLSGASGFYEVGSYKAALKWGREADRLSSNETTKAFVENANIKADESVAWSTTVLGGAIFYSDNSIEERGDVYTYSYGNFSSVSSRWDWHGKHSLELSYSRFNASFKKNFYGVDFQDTLYHSLDSDQNWNWDTQYSVSDSLNSWTSSSDQNGYAANFIVDTIYVDLDGDSVPVSDSSYVLYSEELLGNYKETMRGNRNNYDTIVEYKPGDVYQNGVYLGYTRWFAGKGRTHLGGAVSLFNSNMEGMETGVTLYGYHGHLIANERFLLNGHWYGTGTDKVQVLQVSPEMVAYLGKVSLRLSPTYLWKKSAPYLYTIPGVQLSVLGGVSVNLNKVHFGGDAVVGKRAFAAESGGRNLVTVTLPHTFTGSFQFSVTPGEKKALTLFAIGRYEMYDQLSRFIALGGITVTL